MTPIKPAQHAAPYGSARDLPSYQELARQIQGGKLLTRFIARNQRSGFLEIERQLDHLVAVVDRFYDRLGSRNWIFHELLPISNVETILDQTAAPAASLAGEEDLWPTLLKASSRAATQKSTSRVLDSRQAST